MKTRFMLIASGKGGTGKTTTALNLGCALTNFGRDVILVDANLSTPHVSIMLGAPLLENTINKALRGTRSIRDTAYIHPSGLRVIPASISPDEYAPDYAKKLQSVIADLANTAEFVLIDAAAGLGPECTEALRAADEMIVVTNPDLPSLSDASKLILLAEERGIAVPGIIVNRFGLPESMTLDNIRSFIGKPIIGTVPEDTAVRAALALKQPLVFSHPDTPAAVSFKKIAATLIGQIYEPEVRSIRRQGMFDRLIERINRIGGK